MKDIQLSELEIYVLKMIALGYENKEIASRLYVSTHSIKAYIAVILKKLKAVNRTHAAYLGVQNDIIPINMFRHKNL